MKSGDEKVFGDICISDISIISGVRPAGRTVDTMACGRSANGILYIWSGETCFTECSHRRVRVKEGELLFIPKGCKYKMRYEAPNTTFVLVNLEMFDRNGSDLMLTRNIEVLAKDDCSKRIAKIMTSLELCGVSQSMHACMHRKELVYKLLGAVYEISVSASLAQQKYPQIFEGVLLLEQSYLENIPISKFAQASNISISLFRSLFGKQYGMSPVQYRNRLRIGRATEILKEGSCSVAEAAFACGFENVGYFCRSYKKITGETPQETKLRHL